VQLGHPAAGYLPLRLCRWRHGSRPCERAGQLGEDSQVSMKPNPITRSATKATPSARARTRKPRRDWRPAFLKGFQKSGTVTGGCAHAAIHRTTAYRERQCNEKFALAWADLELEVTDKLEATALLMALRGDVRLIEFLLKARKPDVYREHHQVELAGPGGGPVELDGLGLDLSKLTDRDLASLQRIAGRAR
jgi:hypothetical protein